MNKPHKKETDKTPPAVAKDTAIPEKHQCNLTLGWDPWEPYQYLTPDDTVQGLEIDLITAMANQVGCQIDFVQHDWMHLLQGIKNGSIDMLGGASETENRKSFAYFSAPYRQESFVLYVRTKQLDKYNDHTLIQLLDNQFRVGVTEDYIYGDQVSDIQDQEKYKNLIVTVPITEVNYYNLIQNNIDGFLEDPFVAGYTIKRKGLSRQIQATNIEVNSGTVSIMFSKASIQPEKVEAFNKALEAIKASGDYQKILDKYSS
ncbi:MAG: transporter substrate-binding domain-containing protein [Enterobacterales bacterium]|nr:transporter substrate-binding domain-containing protein [Enterobacterales bacterium]